MPLAFQSDSHGSVAFGFFNIESDLLILDQYFFFATDFCLAINGFICQQTEQSSKISIAAFLIENRQDIGDLHGAIAGQHFSGFIGETYKRYPFPQHQTDFKQQTRGFESRDEFAEMLSQFGKRVDLHLEDDNNLVKLGPYQFTMEHFYALINYVIEGGYPRWQDGIAPDYVQKMQQNMSN